MEMVKKKKQRRIMIILKYVYSMMYELKYYMFVYIIRSIEKAQK